jgi:DNA-binding FadR family transcriptional regulator
VQPAKLFAPVSPRRTFQDAVEQIGEAIYRGRLQVGDRLPSERAAAAQLGISRPSLREAIRVLVNAGVLETRSGPGGGVFVRSDVVPLGLIERPSDLKISEISAVLEARRLFEPAVAQLAGLYALEEDFEIIQSILGRQRDARRDRVRFIQLDIRFHLAIAAAAHNPIVVEQMRNLLHRLQVARELAIRDPHEPKHALELHERTLAAIMTRLPHEISEAMDEHLSYLERIWEEAHGRPLLRKMPNFAVVT